MPTKVIRILCQYLVLFIVAAATTTANPATANVGFSASVRDVSLHEPVFADIQIVNHENVPIDVDLGKDRKTNFVVSFEGPNGRTGKNIRLSWEGIGAGGIVTIAGGATYQQSLLLNEWVPFDRPGKYHITLGLENFHTGGQQNRQNNPSLSEFDINILPFDLHRLQNVCAALEQRIESTDDAETILEAAHALSSVVDETAVPYLGRSLTKGVITPPIIIPTLEKIGSRAAARALIKSLNELPAEYPVLARNALVRIKAQTNDSSLRLEIQKALQAPS